MVIVAVAGLMVSVCTPLPASNVKPPPAPPALLPLPALLDMPPPVPLVPAACPPVPVAVPEAWWSLLAPHAAKKAAAQTRAKVQVRKARVRSTASIPAGYHAGVARVRLRAALRAAPRLP